MRSSTKAIQFTNNCNNYQIKTPGTNEILKRMPFNWVEEGGLTKKNQHICSYAFNASTATKEK